MTGINLDQVDRRSLSDAVFEQLRERIVSDALPAGSELPSERQLCDLLGVNRGAVREGLKRLQQAGLVAIRQGGKTQVRDYLTEGGLELLPALLVDAEGHMRVQVARSILRMRESLAPAVARQAAEAAAPETVARLRACISAMRDSEDLAELQQLAWDYWQALVDGSGNIAYRLAFNSLGKTYRQIWSLLRQALAPEFRDVDNLEALATAVEAGDADTAEQRARAHVAIGTASMLALLDAHDGPTVGTA